VGLEMNHFSRLAFDLALLYYFHIDFGSGNRTKALIEGVFLG
jgi:hypothetical protein